MVNEQTVKEIYANNAKQYKFELEFGSKEMQAYYKGKLHSLGSVLGMTNKEVDNDINTNDYD